MTIKQESNEPSEEFLEVWKLRIATLDSKYRIEAHVYVNEWIALTREANLRSLKFTSLATKLMVMLTAHVKALTTSWFPRMLISSKTRSLSTYMPCWKCYADAESSRDMRKGIFLLA